MTKKIYNIAGHLTNIPYGNINDLQLLHVFSLIV